MEDSSHISLKTLGRGVTLGELYDARSSQFLGVQICPVADIKEITHTSHPSFLDSRVISSKSLKSRTDVLDINPELSVEILSGLVSVRGAASYLNDIKSNSKEYAWGLSLYARVKQEQFDVNHSSVITSINKTDVIKHYGTRATHVVTEIVYGGTIIVNFVAKEESKIEDTHIAGKLEAQLKKLTGAFDMSGQVQLEVKEACSKISKDLDITIHADIALDRLPVDIDTLLAVIPDACKNLNSNPVPIAVVVKRIPFEDFTERDHFSHLQESFVNDVIAKFGELIDIQNRFFALQGSTAKHKDLIPNLVSAVNGAAMSFQILTTPLLERLAASVAAYKAEKPMEGFLGLLTDVETEIDKQKKSSSQTFSGYPTHLTGLEDAFKSFAVLIYKVVNRTIDPMFYITALPDLRKDIVIAPIVALLIVPPLPAQPGQIDDLTLRTLLIDAVAYYASANPPLKLHIIYAEDLSTTDTTLRGNGMFMQLKEASVFLGQKKMGAISWTPVPENDIVNAVDLRLYYTWITTWFSGSLLYFHRSIPGEIVQGRSQTLILRAQYYGNADISSCAFALVSSGTVQLPVYYKFYIRRVQGSNDTIDYLDVEVVRLKTTLGYLVDKGSALRKLNPMQDFYCAFVQDFEKSPATWTLYFNGVPVGKLTDSFSAMWSWIGVRSAYADGQVNNVMTGKYYDVRIYDSALNQDQIQNIVDSLPPPYTG